MDCAYRRGVVECSLLSVGTLGLYAHAVVIILKTRAMLLIQIRVGMREQIT